jgi:hypothetical protein
MRYKEAHRLLHDCLIFNYGKIQEPLENQLKNLEKKRATIHETHRNELESKIGITKDMIKEIKEQELRLREIFNYIEY